MTIRNGLRWIEKRKQWYDSAQTARERVRERERDWQLHAARRFFASSMSGSKALYSARFLRAESTRGKREGMQPVSARVPASLSSAFVRPSFVPLLYMRRGRVSRRVMHISLNRPGNSAFNISELFSRRERAYSARFSERGRFCPPPFIAHLSSCARRLFAMRRSKVAKRVHSRTSLAPTLLSRHPHFFLRPSNTYAFRLACCDFLFTSLYPCNELQSIEKYAKKIIYSFCLISALLIVKLIDISFFYNC